MAAFDELCFMWWFLHELVGFGGFLMNYVYVFS